MDQFARSRIESLERRVEHLEQTLARVLAALHLEADDPVLAAARELVRQGKRNDAIVLLHRDKGMSLAEATAAVAKL